MAVNNQEFEMSFANSFARAFVPAPAFIRSGKE